MASSATNESSATPMADINVTPMADVMLVLLIVFMITAPLSQHKVKVELPQANLVQDANKPAGSMDLAIKEDGSFYLDDAPVSDGELNARLKVAAQQTPQPELKIRAAKTIEYSRIWDVMSTAKGAGMVHLGFVTTGQDKKTVPVGAK
ncbi:MAG: biopolymer transporter ExbD [Rhodanobacteraceae bacterium]